MEKTVRLVTETRRGRDRQTGDKKPDMGEKFRRGAESYTWERKSDWVQKARNGRESKRHVKESQTGIKSGWEKSDWGEKVRNGREGKTKRERKVRVGEK
jgi:hypothetical protein